VSALAEVCYNGQYSLAQIKKMITGEGGYVAYLGTNNAAEVNQMAQCGNQEAKLIQEALCYQVAKEIGAVATVVAGQVDTIILTGGMAHLNVICETIRDRVKFIAPVLVYPGEDEMKALAANGLMILKHEILPEEYT
jgi:butyrate kinase